MTIASLNAVPIAALCQEAPSTGAGYRVHLSNDWRLVVEHLNARNSQGNGAVWGTAVWGPTQSDDQWGGLAWDADIGGDVRGLSIERGADEPYGRPRAGVLTLRLTDPVDGYNPWENTNRKIRVGSVIRVGLRSATDTRGDGWLPLFCGVVESDPVEYIGIIDGDTTSDKVLDVTVVEPLNELAQINDNALGAPVGAGDNVGTRLVRLLEQDGVWRFGLIDGRGSGDPGITLQSTDMADNRLTEVYLSGDSAAMTVRIDRTGAMLLEPHWDDLAGRDVALNKLSDFSSTSLGSTLGEIELSPNPDGASGGVWNLSYDIESVESGNDTGHIRNDIRYTRVGGTQEMQVHAQSRGRFGRRQHVRNDLICQTDGQVEELIVFDLNRWARIALRVENVTVTSTLRPEVMLVCAAADVYDRVRFLPPTSTGGSDPAGEGYIRRVRHDITPLHGRVHWVTSWSVDFDELFNLPGEELDEVV